MTVSATGGGQLLRGMSPSSIRTYDERRPSQSPVPGGDRVQVCVRVRPFVREERRRDGGRPVLCVHMPSRTCCELQAPGEQTRTFEMDRCYWSHDIASEHFASQEVLYAELGCVVVDHAVRGFNNCIFAYGQTASGKSHSVLGDGSDEGQGLLPRMAQGLLERLGPDLKDAQGRCLASFIELYNEQLRDLLADGGCASKKLGIRQHPALGTFVPGVVEAAVGGPEDVLALLAHGQKHRTVAATAMNHASSRSHCLFTFKTSVLRAGGLSVTSQTHIVDLAGSERVRRAKTGGKRLREGGAINQSLLALTQVISELAKTQGGRPPFRNSKLTHLLKESLSGNSRTVMLAAVSPSLADYDETLSTLKFAQSVKFVRTKVRVNEVNQNALEEQLQRELHQLRDQLKKVEAEKSADASMLSLVKQQLQDHEDLTRRYTVAWSELLSEERRRSGRREAFTCAESPPLKSVIRGGQGSRFNVDSTPGDRSSSDSEDWDCWGRGSSTSSGDNWGSSASTSAGGATAPTAGARRGGRDKERETLRCTVRTLQEELAARDLEIEALHAQLRQAKGCLPLPSSDHQTKDADQTGAVAAEDSSCPAGFMLTQPEPASRILSASIAKGFQEALGTLDEVQLVLGERPVVQKRSSQS